MNDVMFTSLIVGILGGIVLSFIIVSYMSASLKSVHSKKDADTYIVRDSLHFDVKREIYTSSRVERFLKQNNQHR